MNFKISKELLSKVLTQTTNQRYFYISNIQMSNNNLSFTFISDEGFNCEYAKNIYELAHKCKEWVKQDFTLESAVSFDKDNIPYCRLIGDIEEEMFEANTEPEAIFKACQWVLDNKNNQ